MPLIRSLWVTILLALPSLANSHGLSPSRLEAPSGSQLVAYRFTAINNYADTETFEVQCFKNNLNAPYACKTYPQILRVGPSKSRTFKVQIAPDGDAVYLVCTLQTKDANIVTRVCARFGVGVSPSLIADSNRVSKSTVNAGFPTGPRQGTGR